MRTADRIAAVLLLVFGAGYALTALRSYTYWGAHGPGTGFFPFWLGLALAILSLLFLVSAIGTGFAFSVWDLIFWRLVGGLGIGLASVIAPAYISEISPRKVRGRLASLQQLAITTGIFAALLSDALFATTAGGADQSFWLGIEAWRWMFLAAAVPAVVGDRYTAEFLRLSGN